MLFTLYPLSTQANGGPIFTDGAWSGFVAFDTPGLTMGQLEAVPRHYYSLGYGCFCPTMVTSSPEAYRTNLPIVRAGRAYDRWQGVLPPHLEGPFLSSDSNPDFRRDPTVAFAEELHEWPRSGRGDRVHGEARGERQPGSYEPGGGRDSGDFGGGGDGVYPCLERGNAGEHFGEGLAKGDTVYGIGERSL